MQVAVCGVRLFLVLCNWNPAFVKKRHFVSCTFELTWNSPLQDKIGWRNGSMRLLVFVSDNDSHFGMDSKLAGIVIPNDGQCHLDSNNEYSMEYPTLGQLIDKLVENNILLLFAVTANQRQNYEVRSRPHRSFRSTAVGFRQQNLRPYHRSLSTLLSAICCSQVAFNVTVELASCLDSPRRFSLRPAGFQDTLEVELESLCVCECHRTARPNSTHCSNGHGALDCGVCACQPGFMGPRCECDDTEGTRFCFQTFKLQTFLIQCVCVRVCICYRPEEGAEMCSGQGECFCGQCVCHPSSFGRVYGKYCECDDFSCLRFRGKLCGGNGKCDCGECVCNSGWTGEYCNCSSSTKACESADGSVCSGRGKCVCGKCVCSVPGASGDKCEKCPTCGDICSKTRCATQCTGSKTELHTFLHQGWLNVIQKQCVRLPPNIPVIALGVCMSVLTIGIILLVVWKFLVSVHDKKEVAKFEAERAKAKWQSVSNLVQNVSTKLFELFLKLHVFN
uniref:Integrin beta n=1 Tax=Astyanax mexicanus TaxID=7994 RepID=A0A3B1JK13_ASTMX